CDNGGEFRNNEMGDFCSQKGIKREFSNAMTPQQNGVVEKRNRTLIEAARTMLADAKLPVTFWFEAVNTACCIQNRVLVNKSHNKTPYELFNGRSPAIGFLKPFRCHVMILNTLDHLGKFEAKGDEGTNSTNLSRIKDATSQEVKKDVSSLRYIALPNWVHDALLESSSIYRMDVKSAFLYGTIDEEVYVMQPPGFQDSEFPAKVYKVEKAMYGLHQPPRAWYAYSDSDCGGASQDRKSTIGGCQFFGRRLISWQCKKQTIVATSTTEAECVAAANGYG
nr:ribonuclease H-like domain-containing protein [Tanacetum cinerariifolium]